MFSLTIDTDNAAFEDDPVAEIEVVMAHLVRLMRSGRTAGVVVDTNGNGVGAWTLSTRSAPR